MKTLKELPKNAFGEPLRYRFTLKDLDVGVYKEQDRRSADLAEFLAERAKDEELSLKTIQLTREDLLTGDLTIYSTVRDLTDLRQQANNILEMEVLEIEKAKEKLKTLF